MFAYRLLYILRDEYMRLAIHGKRSGHKYGKYNDLMCKSSISNASEEMVKNLNRLLCLVLQLLHYTIFANALPPLRLPTLTTSDNRPSNSNLISSNYTARPNIANSTLASLVT